MRKHTFGPNALPLLASREEHANLNGRTEFCITPGHVTGTELWSGERADRRTDRVISIPQRSADETPVTFKGASREKSGRVRPPLLPSGSGADTPWRTTRRRIRASSPKTRSRRSGCRVKTAFPKSTFLKERVRMTAWRRRLASAALSGCVNRRRERVFDARRRANRS